MSVLDQERFGVLREAAAWAWSFRSAIPDHQWDELSESKIRQLAEQVNDASFMTAVREAIKWGAGEGQIVGGSQWAAERDNAIARIVGRPANPLDVALRRLREISAASVPGYNPMETWGNIVADANDRGLCVRLEVIQKDYGVGQWERFEVKYARPDGREVPVTGVFAADAKLEVYLHGERVPGCFATRDTETQSAWLDRVFANDRGLMGVDHVDHVPFTVPLDWDGAVQVKGCVLESDGSVAWAESVGRSPAFYGVYAGRSPGGYRHVADFDHQTDAERFASTLSVMAQRFGNTMPEFWDRRRYDVGLPEDLPRPSWGSSWSFTESAKARAEGWDLVADPHDSVIAAVPDGAEDSVVALPRAGAPLDEAARAKVEAKALDGSELHLKALLYVLSHSIHGQTGQLFKASPAMPAAREAIASEPTEDAEIEDLNIGGFTP